MKTNDFRRMGLYRKIEKNKKLSRNLKVLAGSILFFSFCYCFGTQSIGNMGYLDKAQVVVTNCVWILSMILLIGLYFGDSACIKNSKVCELEIYRLEVEELENKKEIAKIREEGLPDYILNMQIEKPDENVVLPISYYSVLVAIDSMVRIYLSINHIL